MRHLLLVLSSAVTLAAWLPIGPDGGYIMALAVDPARPETLYCVPSVATLPPLFRTTDAGANWARSGEAPLDGISALVIDPFTPSYLYGVNGNSYVLRSTDAGASWSSVSTGLYSNAIACDPLVSGRVYAAGAFYDSINTPAFAVSTDHGATWSEMLVADDTGYAYSIDVSPLDSGVVFLGCDYGTVFRSTDAGATWQRRSSGLSPDDIVLSISVNHGNSSLLCAGTVYGMFRTTDAGLNWAQVGDPRFVMSIDFSPAVPGMGFASGYDTAAAAWHTTDSGRTWWSMTRIAPSSRSGGLLADPAMGNGAWCATQSGVFHTSDRGMHWDPRSSGIHTATISALSVPFWNREHVYAALEGVGVFKSPDGGRNWEQTEDFLSCGNICGIGLAPSAGADVLYALEGSG